jgi:hypothetical protein
MLKHFQLPQESLSRFSHLEASIAHWSHEHTVLCLKARKSLEGIDNLFQVRQKIVDDFLKEQDVQAKDVASVNISPSGEVVVVMKEPDFQGADGPPDGAAAVEGAKAPSNGAA